MMRRLRSLWTRPRDLASPSSRPDGEALFAIGDIHGHSDLLAPLLAEIRLQADRSQRTLLVPLGDYVDRGPDSRAVVDLLLETAAHPRIEAHFLRGNHDQTLLDFLADHTVGPAWCGVGGRQTLFSYGIEPPATRKHMELWLQARDDFAANLPGSHLEFYRSLAPSFTWRDWFFTHAGAQPGVPLEDQTEHDLMWIRHPFLKDEARFEKIVVHGHTPADQAYADHRRIGLDTGAYMTGVLTACRFDGSGQTLIQSVKAPDGGAELRSTPF